MRFFGRGMRPKNAPMALGTRSKSASLALLAIPARACESYRVSGRWIVVIIVIGPVLLLLLGTLFELLR